MLPEHSRRACPPGFFHTPRASKASSVHLPILRHRLEAPLLDRTQRTCSTAQPSTRQETSTLVGRHPTLGMDSTTSGSHLRMTMVKRITARSRLIRMAPKVTCPGSLPAITAGWKLSITAPPAHKKPPTPPTDHG